MSINGVVQIFIKNDVAAAMAPAAHVDGNADGRRMTGSVLNVHAHDGVLAAHALRTKADGVDAVLQQLLHIGCALVLVVAAQRTHQSLLGQQSGSLNRGGNAHAHQQRRAGIDAVADVYKRQVNGPA